MCVHMLTYRYTVLCGLLLSNTSLIKLVDYVSKDPPSEWTTGSDHTNGSGATPSASVPRVEFPSQPLSLSQRECVPGQHYYTIGTSIFMVAWERSWKTPTVECRNVPRKTYGTLKSFLECCLFHPLECVQIYCEAPLGLYFNTCWIVKIVLLYSLVG